jgi:predicted transcriptional regulator
MKITVSNRILLHLLQHHCIEGYKPTYQATQPGIANSVNIERSNVPKFVKKLIQEKLVEEKVEHVKGLKRKLLCGMISLFSH